MNTERLKLPVTKTPTNADQLKEVQTSAPKQNTASVLTENSKAEQAKYVSKKKTVKGAGLADKFFPALEKDNKAAALSKKKSAKNLNLTKHLKLTNSGESSSSWETIKVECQEANAFSDLSCKDYDKDTLREKSKAVFKDKIKAAKPSKIEEWAAVTIEDNAKAVELLQLTKNPYAVAAEIKNKQEKAENNEVAEPLPKDLNTESNVSTFTLEMYQAAVQSIIQETLATKQNLQAQENISENNAQEVEPFNKNVKQTQLPKKPSPTSIIYAAAAVQAKQAKDEDDKPIKVSLLTNLFENKSNPEIASVKTIVHPTHSSVSLKFVQQSKLLKEKPSIQSNINKQTQQEEATQQHRKSEEFFKEANEAETVEAAEEKALAQSSKAKPTATVSKKSELSKKRVKQEISEESMRILEHNTAVLSKKKKKPLTSSEESTDSDSDSDSEDSSSTESSSSGSSSSTSGEEKSYDSKKRKSKNRACKSSSSDSDTDSSDNSKQKSKAKTTDTDYDSGSESEEECSDETDSSSEETSEEESTEWSSSSTTTTTSSSTTSDKDESKKSAKESFASKCDKKPIKKCQKRRRSKASKKSSCKTWNSNNDADDDTSSS